MVLRVEREAVSPTPPPVEKITFGDRYKKRQIVIRPTQGSPSDKSKRTIECTHRAAYGEVIGNTFKWVAMTGELREFAQAILDFCDGK